MCIRIFLYTSRTLEGWTRIDFCLQDNIKE